MKTSLLQQQVTILKELLEHYKMFHDSITSPQVISLNRDLWEQHATVLESSLSALESIEQEGKEAITDKQKYVVGFMFDSDRNNVVLIRKQKPAWQKNKLNGVGGKIESGETPLQAMYREYKEEAGIAFAEWDNFLTIEYKSCIVYFFKGFSTACYEHSETKEIERIEKYCLDGLPFSQMIFNLNWIIFMALDPDIRQSEAFEVSRMQSPAPTVDEPLYAFMYNPDTNESCAATMSVHKTRKGAEIAMENHKAKKRKEHDEQVNWEKENTPEGIVIDETFGRWEYWGIHETTVLP